MRPNDIEAWETGAKVPGGNELLRAIAWLCVEADDVTAEVRR